MGDRQTDKTSRWAFTAYEAQWPLFTTVLDPLIAEQGWQKEVCPDTQREHYQGFIRTTRQVRFAQMRKIYPGVHIEAARNWDALVNYCKKSETAIPGSQVNITAPEGAKPMTMAQALIYLASNIPYFKYDWSALNPQQTKDLKDKILNDSIEACLRINRNLIGIYANNIYRSAFNNHKQMWIDFALEEARWADLDRQTDMWLGCHIKDD